MINVNLSETVFRTHDSTMQSQCQKPADLDPQVDTYKRIAHCALIRLDTVCRMPGSSALYYSKTGSAVVQW